MAMIQQVTQGIRISVESFFEGTYFKNYRLHFSFGYRVSIANQGKDIVQLQSRHWKIFDALKATSIVDGEGVVGKKPVIKPGQVYSYQSGCLLCSPLGAMVGHFNMVNLASTKKFRAYIPKFELSTPFALN
jgi:ApaG protein